MNNIQFATALHILTLLAAEDNLSSAYLAGSIGINPAMVRKSVSNLAAHGLVLTREGKGGGVSLAKPASQIMLSDIYKAINQTPLLGRTNNTNPDCPVGKQINNHLNGLYKQAYEALVKQLDTLTLANFHKQFN